MVPLSCRGHVDNGRIPGMMKHEGIMALTAASFASGWKDIGAAFGVSSRIARQWTDEGAPVVMVTPSTPCVCRGELWEWLKGRGRNHPSPLPEKTRHAARRGAKRGKMNQGGSTGRKNQSDGP